MATRLDEVSQMISRKCFSQNLNKMRYCHQNEEANAVTHDPSLSEVIDRFEVLLV